MITSNLGIAVPPDIIIGGLIFSSSQTGRIACLCLDLAYKKRSDEDLIQFNTPKLVEFARLSAMTKLARRKLNTINGELRNAAAVVPGGITTQHNLTSLYSHGVSATVLMRKINESDFIQSREVLSRLKYDVSAGFEGVVGETDIFEGRFNNGPSDLESAELVFFQNEIERRIGVVDDQKVHPTVKLRSNR